jgi:hypothetical protein
MNYDEICRLIPPKDKHFLFDFYFDAPRFELFYLDEKFMKFLGVKSDAIVAVIQIKEFIEGVYVIAWMNEELIFSLVKYDESLRFFFILDRSNFPLPVIRENILGKPVGYVPFSDCDDNFWNFKKLKND